MVAPIRIAAVASLFLLSSCWTGEPFYAANEVQAPIPPGVYQTDTPSSADQPPIRVAVRADGYTIFRESNGDETIAGFVPLPDGGGRLVAWFEIEDSRDPALWYGLLEKSGRDFSIGIPMCDQTRALVESVGGAFVADPKAPICKFPDRASLESGLRRVAAEGPLQWTRFVRLDAGGS